MKKMNRMSQYGVVIALLAFTLMNCTNQGNKNEDAQTEDQEVVDMHTSETSLDWAGVYEGTMPCASCEGIETVIELRDDHTYTGTYTYMGEDEYTVVNEGTFTFDITGNTVTLQAEDQTSQFKVEENQITLLGADGELNTGELADFYVLKKKM